METFTSWVLDIVYSIRLFDMDGTLLDSTAGVVGAWEKFKETYPGIDIHKILDSAWLRAFDAARAKYGVKPHTVSGR